MKIRMAHYTLMMKEFHETFDVPQGKRPTLLSAEDSLRRTTLITSEVGELGDAVREKDIVKAADALGDILYVVFGMAEEMGLDMDRIFTEIHESNMSKLKKDGTVLKDAGGKVLKPETYQHVDLSWILEGDDETGK